MVKNLEEYLLIGMFLGRNGNTKEILATACNEEELRRIWTYFDNISAGFEVDLPLDKLRKNYYYQDKLKSLKNVNKGFYKPIEGLEKGRYFRAKILGIYRVFSRDKYTKK
jgi:hypothetical protein